MFDVNAFQVGALHFLIAFVAACLFTVLFKAVYQVITPYNDGAQIRAGNTAAAVALGGALLGYVLPLASALTQTVSLWEFAAWALLAGVIQIVTYLLVRLLVVKDMAKRIEGGELAPAVYLASLSLCVGVLNAASMTA